LRALHETECADCPVPDRNASYLALAESNYRMGNYDTSHFPDSFDYASAEEAWRVLQAGKMDLSERVLLHGDYCLPNIMLDGWRFSGFIDLDHAGVGDRHIDIYWALWSLKFNLRTDIYAERFMQAYGKDRIDPRMLHIITAAEAFG